MSVNYYIKEKHINPADGETDGLHIGKFSINWVFQLRVYPELNINNLEMWLDYLEDKEVVNEYGRAVSHLELAHTIMWGTGDLDFSKQHPDTHKSWETIHKDNHSTTGPNGLFRSQEGEYTRHGEGTWDYISRDFF